MAIITIPKKTFEKEIGKFNEDMQNRIALFGTPIEDISDSEFKIEVFPNRPDLLSYHGFKRAFLAYLGKNRGLREYKIIKPEKNYDVFVDSSVKNIRPYTVCAIVKGLQLDNEKIKEIIEAQEKLHATLGRKRKKAAIGIYPLEKISLPITFKALEPDKIKFIPLESAKELSGLEILQKHPSGKEYAHLLAGKIKFPIFVDSRGQILSMPPIINSELTGKVTENTKDVFIECSGSEFSVLEKCLNILVTCFAEMGGRIYQMNLKGLKGKGTKSMTPDLTPEKMPFKISEAEKLLGISLAEKEAKLLLERMGFNYNSGKGIVEIPAWRADILHHVDLIEDIAIAYGYDNFIPEIPDISTISQENPREILKRKFAQIFAGLGILEIMTYHLTNAESQFENMDLANGKDMPKGISVKESKTEYSLLRENLSHKALKVLSENIDAEYPQKIFELGKVFSLDGKNIDEKECLSIAISPGNFTEIKQVLEYFFKAIGLKESLGLNEPDHPENHFIEGRAADILYAGKKIGSMGEIHPRILRNWKIKMPVALLEISLEEILNGLEKY